MCRNCIHDGKRILFRRAVLGLCFLCGAVFVFHNRRSGWLFVKELNVGDILKSGKTDRLSMPLIGKLNRAERQCANNKNHSRP